MKTTGLEVKNVIISGNKIYKGKAIVCFLDLLGFSNEIRRQWNNKEKSHLDEVLSLKIKIITIAFLIRLIMRS